MPVSFRGLLKGSAFGRCKVLAKNTLEEEDFFAKTKGLDLASAETRFTFARRTETILCLLEKIGKNNNEVRL